MKLVNIVATGDIRQELELNSLYEDIPLPSVDYSPENFPGLIIRDLAGSTTILIFSSGKFTVTGASSHNEMEGATDILQDSLTELGIIENNTHLQLEIVNLVYSAEVRLDIPLEALLVELGFENIEYEPEISPFIIYRPENNSCVITISDSGKIVITGVTSENTAKSVLSNFKRQIQSVGE